MFFFTDLLFRPVKIDLFEVGLYCKKHENKPQWSNIIGSIHRSTAESCLVFFGVAREDELKACSGCVTIHKKQQILVLWCPAAPRELHAVQNP